MQVDYIIVGMGLAGISFCEQLRANNKTFVVFDDASQQSSVVAGGLYNPVVLKRFTSVWKSKEQLLMALPMYKRLEKRLQVKLDYGIPVYRKFTSLEEQNDWFTASDKPNLTEYLSTKLIKNNNNCIDAPFGFGGVLKTGRIDTTCLIEACKKELVNEGVFFKEGFNYSHLKQLTEGVEYKSITAKHIVFAEGYGISKNPFFNTFPLLPTKGELLVIEAPKLKIDFVLKSAVFLIPLQNHLYIVGATYRWDDTTNKTTKPAREELLTKLKTLITCPFNVVKQVAGIRPTVKDRRPLVGRHPINKNCYVLNGLGTRGVMIGPYVAHQLYRFIEHGIPLENEVDVKRFLD